MKTFSIRLGFALTGLAFIPAMFCAFHASVQAREVDEIVPPAEDDEYARLVRAAESGDQNVNFGAMRNAWVNSSHYKDRARATGLRQKLLDAADAGDPTAVAHLARLILSLNYVDMAGHKFLRQACAQLHDAICEQQHHFVEFGLLKSIVQHGDGTSCRTAWPVVSIDEEYFILGMSGFGMMEQSLVSDQGHNCDMIVAADENGIRKTVFFNVDRFIGKM